MATDTARDAVEVAAVAVVAGTAAAVAVAAEVVVAAVVVARAVVAMAKGTGRAASTAALMMISIPI